MKQFFIITLSILFFAACQSRVEPSGLDKALIRSFKDNSYKPLQKYFPTKSVYRSLAKELPERSDAEIDSFLNRSNEKLKDAWEQINTTVNSKMIDPEKIIIKETIVYNPFRESSMQAMIIVYDYEGKTWDDLTMVIHQSGDTAYLLEIPNPMIAFSFFDTSLAESSQAKAVIALKTPEFQQKIREHVTQMIDWAKKDKINEFSGYVVYNGDDKRRSWKSAVNIDNDKEKKLAMDAMDKVKKATNDCTAFSFDTIQAERESEGYWIVQPIVCGKKIIRFAFLKIGDKLLMGNIDIEMKEE